MYLVGIDLGGTNVAVGVVNEDNKIVGTASLATNSPRPAEEVADTMAEAVRLAVEDAGISLDQVSGIGVGIPGSVSEEGIILFAPNMGFQNVPMKALLEARLGKPTYLGNDANCAALGEQKAGCGNGVPNFIAVTLGTGVGGGIILNGQLLTGINGAAGEIGHMVVEPDGIPCQCGRKGCFEKYASATGLIAQTKEALKKDTSKTSLMWQVLKDGDPENTNGITSFKAARQGDPLALEVVDNYITYLATGVTNLINIFQPNMVCIGGGISKEGEFLLNPLREKVAAERYTRGGGLQTEIVAATLGNDAGIIGAALLATL